MRIGLDARNLLPKQTGIGRSVYNLIANIASLDYENEYVVIKRACYKSTIVDKENFSEISIPYDPSSFRSCFFGFSKINELNLDVYHSFFHFLPGRIKAKRIIVTLHDLMWIENPDLVFDDYFRRRIINFYGKIFIKKALKNADDIVAISQYTKDNALRRYNLSENNMHVIYHGIDFERFNMYASTKLPEEFQNRKYIISIGHTRPYKNVPRIIRAFKIIRQEFPQINLLIIGRGDYEKALKKLVSELHLQDSVIFGGHLPDEKMIPLFKNAEFLAFPPLIEGFGLPVIEAMALGCPILSSDIPVIEEIAGDVYEKVNPQSVDDIARGMQKLLGSKQYRDTLRNKGYERAKIFSWEQSAKKLLSLYNKN